MSCARAHQADRVYVRFVVITLAVLTLSGCYTANHARLSTDLRQRVTVGLPMSKVLADLSQDGFSCDLTLQSPEVDCSRARYGAVLYTCIERVALKADAATQRVSSFHVPPIACAGL